MATAAVVLAAGASTRMGSPKPLVQWRGRAFVTHLIELAKAAGAEPVVVVQGAWSLPADVVGDATVVDHRQWEAGPLSSLQAGLAEVLRSAAVSSVLVLTVDRPHLQTDTVIGLLRAFGTDPSGVWQPRHDEKRGHPVVLPRDVAESALRMTPTRSLRDLLRDPSIAPRRRSWDTVDAAVLDNIDTPDDVRRLLAAVE